MTSSGLEWDYFDCEPEGSGWPSRGSLVQAEALTPPSARAGAQTDWLAQVLSTWSMSSGTESSGRVEALRLWRGESRTKAGARARAREEREQDKQLEQQQQHRRQWRKTGRETGRSEREEEEVREANLSPVGSRPLTPRPTPIPPLYLALRALWLLDELLI